MRWARRPTIYKAIAYFCVINAYEAMRKDHEGEKAKRQTTNRKANQVQSLRSRAGGCCGTFINLVNRPVRLPREAPTEPDEPAALLAAAKRRDTLSSMAKSWVPGATTRAHATQMRRNVTR